MRQGLCSIMRRTALAWRTMWPKMDSARIELPGLVSTKSRSVVRPMMDLRLSCCAIVLLLLRLGRDLGALCLEYLSRGTHSPAATPACRYHTTTTAPYLPFVTSCYHYFHNLVRLIVPIPGGISLYWPPALTTPLCDEHSRYIAPVLSSDIYSPTALAAHTYTSPWTYQHTSWMLFITTHQHHLVTWTKIPFTWRSKLK